MAEKAILSKKKTHTDKDGLGPIPSWSEGVDTFKVEVPAGYKFSRYEITRSNVLADCQVTKAPKRGETGEVELKVKWNYALFGTAKYRVRLYAADGKLRPIRIDMGSAGWEQRALDLVRQDVPFVIRVVGAAALTIFNLLNPRSVDVIRRSYEADDEADRTSELHISREPLTAIAITAGAFVLIGLAGFVALAFVMQKAIDAGLCVNAKHNVRGPSSIEDELELDVHAC